MIRGYAPQIEEISSHQRGYGILESVQKCPKKRIKPIIVCWIRLYLRLRLHYHRSKWVLVNFGSVTIFVSLYTGIDPI